MTLQRSSKKIALLTVEKTSTSLKEKVKQIASFLPTKCPHKQKVAEKA